LINNFEIYINMMKCLKKFVFLVLFLQVFFSFDVLSQTKTPVYIGMAGLNNLQERYIQQNSLKKIFVFYQKDVSKNGMTLDSDLFQKNILNRVSSGQKGIAIIDWEGLAFDALTSSDERKASAVVSEFIKALELAKQLRPNLQWGFYGLPIRTFKGDNRNWRNINTRLAPIFRRSDIIAPSLYMYNSNPKVYNLNSPQAEKGAGDYLYLNLDYALELGSTYNKDVYPFIWHKRNSGDRQEALSLIPIDTFGTYVKMINSRSAFGKKIKGVIWWDNAKYYYLNRNKYPVVLKEYSNVKNVEQYNLDIFKKYYNAIK